MDRRWAVAVAVAFAALAAGAWLGNGVGAPTGGGREPTSLPVGTVGSGHALIVHVSGWVASPGLVELPEGARLGDAIAAAGGVRPGAGLDSVNLAQVLADGQQVVVPGPGAASSPTGEAAPASDGKVHVNQATAGNSNSSRGWGRSWPSGSWPTARRWGPFQAPEDLLGVSGIGGAKLASIRDLVVVP